MPATTWIRLMGIEFSARYGALPEEARHPVHYVIDVEARYPQGDGWPERGLSAVIDYRIVQGLLRDILDEGGQGTLEYLAHRLAEAVLELPLVEEVRLTLRKPSPPLDAPTRCAEIEVHASHA